MNTNGYEQRARHPVLGDNQPAADGNRQVRRSSWRAALGLLIGAPYRVHHYRDLHTRMLHDALCESECCGDSGA